ncbi:MAG: bifunctional shikimate kinase/shikimate dehydrogenase [Methanomicrobiales archaeon]|nr:bifunctional shikimate kinase/shikimate dehydrogenase [Methanomicrobiales archaeon]
MRVVLIGFRGAGKTHVGKLVATRMGTPFLDLDREIEARAGRPVPEIFAAEGEAGFRRRERQVIATLPQGPLVVAAGGGAVLDQENVRHLREGSRTVLLRASEAAILDRIRGSSRPSLTGRPLEEEVPALLAARRTAYLSAADFCVDTTSLSPQEACQRIGETLDAGTVAKGAREEGLRLLDIVGIPAGDLRRVRKILAGDGEDPLTRICGVAGNPVLHSRTPALQNALFVRYGLGFFSTFFQPREIGTLMQTMRLLDLRGCAVTIPFKEQVIPHLDVVDRDAETIGAVNTVVQCGGELSGFNTDWLGIRGPLEHLRGARAVLVGAGGAAAAAAHAMVSLRMQVTILNRSPGRARQLADRIGSAHGPLSDLERLAPDVVVHATPVGMHPDRGMAIPARTLSAGMTVFDLVYTPPETPLIRAARAAGCRAIPGTEMFIRQAREQFRYLTGILPGEGEVRGIVES